MRADGMQTGRARPTEPGSSRGVSRVVVFTVLVYVMLWGIEGAVRKWVPGTETAFYILRDVFVFGALVILHLASSGRRANVAWFWTTLVLLGVVTAVHVVVGLTTLTNGVVGLRSYIAPLLLLSFVLCVREVRLLRTIGFATCVIALVNLPVTILQVLSPPAAAVNKGVGTEFAYFVNPGDIVRPSGTFSAPAGHTALLPLALAVALGGLISGRIPRPLAICTIVSVSTMTLLSGSRGAAIGVLLVFLVFVASQVRRSTRNAAGWAVGAAAILVPAIWAVSIAFPAVIRSFSDRVEAAGRSEDFGLRLFEVAFGMYTAPFSIVGDGIGSRGNVAVARSGTRDAWVESDIGRTVAELGVLGFGIANLRILLAAAALSAILFFAKRYGIRAVLLLSVLAPTLLFGSIHTFPTSQGAFSILASLLFLELRCLSLEGKGELRGSNHSGSSHLKRSRSVLKISPIPRI
jgi:hypothetical protein